MMVMMVVGVSVPKIFRQILQIAAGVCWKNSHDSSIRVVEGDRLCRVSVVSNDALG